MGRDYPNDSIAENSQNPETSPGNLKRHAVTQTSVKNHQLTLMWKTQMRKNNNNHKLDLLLWPRDQETELLVEACWLSQTQEEQTEQIHPQTFDNPFYWLYRHDLHALGSHWTDSQQGIICWGFKGVQQEIPSEEASTLQIRSVAFPPEQCTSPQLHPCHRLFDQDGHQDTSSASQ